MAYIRDVLGHYTFQGPMSETEILAAAEDILARRLERAGSLTSPRDTTDFLRMRIGHLPHEEFHIVYLDNRHRVLGTEKLFNGTVDGSAVHPREVVKAVLRTNAQAVVLAHNHPSGVPEPSEADRQITKVLRDALSLIEVRVLDHIVIGATSSVSFAERGLL